MWSICTKEYDADGNLTMMSIVQAEHIAKKWREIEVFLATCPRGHTREIQFSRDNKRYPSRIADDGGIRFGEPICARLPSKKQKGIFALARAQGIME